MVSLNFNAASRILLRLCNVLIRSQCHGSCMQFAIDTEPQCPNWASEGECTGNFI